MVWVGKKLWVSIEGEAQTEFMKVYNRVVRDEEVLNG